MDEINNRRILVIDDNPSIHEDFRKVLCAPSRDPHSLDEQEAIIFGEAASEEEFEGFHVDSAYQGNVGIELIEQARVEGRPYSVAFVDMRMPPGWDGVETLERVWETDPDIQIVLCSAYSHHTTDEILERVGVSDRLLLLKKPCDSADILLIATAMNKKWNLGQCRKQMQTSDREHVDSTN